MNALSDVPKMAMSVVVLVACGACHDEKCLAPYATPKAAAYDILQRSSRTAAARIHFQFVEDCTLESHGSRPQGMYDIIILENNFGLENNSEHRVLSFASGTIAGFDETAGDDWIVEFAVFAASEDLPPQEFPCGSIDDVDGVYVFAPMLNVPRDASMFTTEEVDEILLQNAPRGPARVSLGGEPPADEEE